MSSAKFNHNKKRNSGLIYEFLVRKMSESLIDEDSSGYKKSLDIIKRYFASGQPMARERELFDVVTTTRGIAKDVARRVLHEVMRAASRLDFKKIDIKKSNIIKEIHKTFGKEFFSDYRFDDYKVYASIQMLINGCNPKSTLSEAVQRVHLQEALVGYMSTQPTVIDDEYKDVDPLVYKIAVKKFNERYNDSLCSSQKKLLSEYVIALASDDTDAKVSKVLNNERKRLLCSIKSAYTIKEIRDDVEMKKKLREAEELLTRFDFRVDSVDRVEDMLLYCRLVEELDSNG